jgi:3-(3-hydroxy-phenyl)propionate hydroxylase
VPQPEVLLDGRRCRLDDVLGPDWAEIVVVAPARQRIDRDDGSAAEVTDVDGVLTRWLRSGRASRVRVRPDRIVRSAG